MDGGRVTAETGSGEDPRLAELLRVNGELAAELRALSADRARAPRPKRIPAARGLAGLRAERDGLALQLEETQAALAGTQSGLKEVQGALEEVQGHREGLERQNQELVAEIVLLRTGPRGLLRRARGRFLERTGLFPSR